MSEFVPTVTISLSEYDLLRKQVVSKDELIERLNRGLKRIYATDLDKFFKELVRAEDSDSRTEVRNLVAQGKL